MPRPNAPRVDAAQRDARALELRAAGASYRQIAEQLGVSVSTAWTCVERGLDRTRREPAGRLRQIEAERLDRLQVEAIQVLRAHHYVVQGGEVVTHNGQELVDHGPTLAAIRTLLAVAERRAKLEGLDAPRKEEILTRQAEQAGEVVGAILTRVIQGLDLGPEVTAKAFNLIRGEIDYGHLTLGELDVEIRRIADELRESDYADAMRGFPAKLARGLNAGFAVLDLDDDQRERVTVAVESFLQHEAEESARLAEETKPKPPDPAQPWWVNSPRYTRNSNGNGNGRGYR
jgi:hypothetical protein